MHRLTTISCWHLTLGKQSSGAGRRRKESSWCMRSPPAARSWENCLPCIASASLPKPALPGAKGLAVVGGLVGGFIIASARNDHYSHDSRVVVVNDRHDDGFWKMVEVREWVPGYWLVERGYHGRSYRRYVEGH